MKQATTKANAAGKTSSAILNTVKIFYILFALILSANVYGQTDALKIRIARGTYSDETIIRFLPDATPAFDANYDSWKLFSFNAAVPNIFTKTSAAEELAINAQPSFTASVTQDVFLKIGTAATYSISAEELGAFSAGVQIIMKDLVSGKLYDLRTTNTYTVSLPLIAQTAAARFQVFFSYPASTQVSNATCSVCSDGRLSISKAGESSWQYAINNAAGTSVSSGTAATYTQTISGLASGDYTVSITGNFSVVEKKPFAVKVTSVLLGATFIEFTATPAAEGINLSWSTAVESNTSYFTVERSEDGLSFEGGEKVPAAGNSSVTREYSAADHHPYKKNSYYRIKLTDLNGDISYSKIVSVEPKETSAFSVFPIPASGTLNVNIDGNNNSEVTVVIRDLSGKTVLQVQTIPSSDHENMMMDISKGISPGVYLISAAGKSGITTQKIIIN